MGIAARKTHRLSNLLLWKHKIKGVKFAVLPPMTTRPNPLVVDKLIFVQTFSPGAVYAFERQTGKLIWRRDTARLGGSHVYYANGTLYAETAHALYAFEPSTGNIIWKFCPYSENGEWIYSSPVVMHDYLFIGDRKGMFTCLNAETGKLLWQDVANRAKNNDVNATPVIYDDIVVTATNSGSAIAYDAGTGKQVWRLKLDGPCIWELLLFKKNILIQTQNSLYLLHPMTGRILNKWQWKGKEIQGQVVELDDAIILTIQDEYKAPKSLKTAQYRNNEELIAISEHKALFKHQYSPHGFTLRADSVKHLLYRTRHEGGIGIVEPNHGTYFHEISSTKHFNGIGPVCIQNNIIYALGSYGTLYALKHP